MSAVNRTQLVGIALGQIEFCFGFDIQALMKQEKNWSLFPHLEFPFMHESLQYRDNSLYALQHIPAQTILFRSSTSSILSMGNLPECILGLKDLTQSNLLALAVLLLKRLPLPQNLLLNKWINGKTSGFVNFSQDLIRATNDEQLQIEYSACRQHYKQEAFQLRRHPGIRQILQSRNIQLDEKQFAIIWQQASQFVNTRCFGFTQDSLIIPGMDWLNYDPSTNCDKLAFITYDAQQQIRVCLDLLKSEESTKQSTTKSYVAIITLQQLAEEEELSFNYGNVCNYDLMKFYGYAVPNNSCDYLQIYVSNYWKKGRMIYYSQVERATTGFQLTKHELNEKFIDFWYKLYHSSQFIQQQKQTAEHSQQNCLIALLQHFSDCRPPRMKQQQFSKCQCSPGFKYLQIYQQEQLSIYQNQLYLIKQQTKINML